MRKLCAILLCGLFVCFGGFLTTEDSYAAHWADQYLNTLASEGIMRGDDSGDLAPDNSITRAEFVAMMNRAFGYSKAGKIKFNDVPTDAWYYDDICTAYNQGYFTGIYADTAGPDTYLKRQQAVAMLGRALKIEETEDSSLDFSDNRSFCSWSKGYINAAVEKDFLSGYPDKTFRPDDYMTRGEMAKVLSKVSGEIVKQEGDNYIGYASGNVSVVESGASVSNTTIPGDLYITAGMGTGYTQLDNVTVGGDLIISGTGNSEKGEVSVRLTDCDINRLIIDCSGTNVMSVRAEGSSVITDTIVKSNTYLEEDASKSRSAFRNVELKGVDGTKLSLSGEFEEVIVKKPGNKLSLDKGIVDKLTIDEDAVKGTVFLEKDTTVGSLFCDTATAVTGTGDIDDVVVNSDGTTISMLPDNIYIRPGVTATINGKPMTSLEAEANSAKPKFIEDYPKYDNLTAVSVDLYAKTNKPGKVYWAVKNVDLVDRGMTEDQLKKPDSKTVVKSGVINVMTEKESVIKASSLTSGVNYEYYMVLEDLKGDFSVIESDKFTTLDIVKPTFLNSTPKITASNESSFTMTVIPSKDVTVYWAVMPTKSVPPTVDTLVKQKLSGAVGKGTVSGCIMNETKDILMTGTTAGAITEKTAYDIYLVAQDKSGNLSTLSKVIGTTLDTTPPHFAQAYPWAEPSDATSLKIHHMANEASTLYWAAYTYDAVFPPVDNATSLTGSALKTAQVRAITTGQKAVKSGNVSVTQDKDALLSISGMAKQTPYDVYLILMDKAGNYSEVTKLQGLKTLDNLAPNATMQFDKVVNAKPMIDSDIKIVFDEIVYYKAADATRVRLKSADAAQLKKTFTLHDKLITTGTTDAVADGFVDYSKVAVAEENGKTIVTFGPACFNGGKGLNSGGTYQFELNNIVDSEGNAMQQKTLLNVFNTAPPLMFMSRYDGDTPLASNEIGFTINPDTAINSNMYFDLILQTDQQIRFELYADGVKLGASSYTIQAGKAKSMACLLNAAAPDYEKFTLIKNTDYKLKLISVNGVSEQNAWDVALNLNVMAVIGEKEDLTNLGNNIDGISDPLATVQSNKNTIVVSNPSVFSTTKTYSDTVNPVLVNGRPIYTPFDTAAKVTVMTDKAAQMYYVVAKKHTIAYTTDAGLKITKPTYDEIMSGLPSPVGSQAGTLNIVSGNKDYDMTLKDLTPNSEYEIFYVIKGKSLDNLEVHHDTFATVPLIKPTFIEDTPKPTTDRGPDYVEFTFKVDTDSKVYWVLYPYGIYDASKPDAKDIIALTNKDSNVISCGNVDVHAGVGVTVKADKMVSTRTYTFFAVAMSAYGDITSDVKVYEPVRSKDLNAPIIQSASTAAEEYVVDPAVTPSAIAYKGSVSVLFSKPLYYSLVEGGTAQPLTQAVLEGLMSSTGIISNIKTTSTTDGGHPIISLSADFSDMKDGDTIFISAHIYDVSANYAGQLVMVFNGTTHKFDISFKK